MVSGQTSRWGRQCRARHPRFGQERTRVYSLHPPWLASLLLPGTLPASPRPPAHRPLHFPQGLSAHAHGCALSLAACRPTALAATHPPAFLSYTQTRQSHWATHRGLAATSEVPVASEAALNGENFPQNARSCPPSTKQCFTENTHHQNTLSRQQTLPHAMPLCSQGDPGDNRLLWSYPHPRTPWLLPPMTSELPTPRAFDLPLLDTGLQSRLLVSPAAPGWAHRQPPPGGHRGWLRPVCISTAADLQPSFPRPARHSPGPAGASPPQHAPATGSPCRTSSAY